MESYINSAVLFIHEYRNMENSDIETNNRFIKRVICPDWVADHLCDSWAGRNNDFGDFYLNLDHTIQGDFIEAWGIQVEGLKEYKDKQAADPMFSLFAPAPKTVTWLHGLIKYFYNNGIGGRKDLILSNLPAQDKRYGNSTNWGSYILSLSSEGRELVLRQLYSHITSKSKI